MESQQLHQNPHSLQEEERSNRCVLILERRGTRVFEAVLQDPY